MESAPIRLGFLGWGEVAYHFAKGLAQAGLTGIVAYSRSAVKSPEGDARRTRAAEAGVELVATPRELCRRAELIVAVTPGKAALAAARSVRAHLRPGHLYVDASTSAVKTMEQVGELLAGKAEFVDAAIMGPVPLNGIKVLIVVSGAQAERFRELTSPYGMNIQVIGEKPGAASAMKLIRSVCMKGLAAVLIETLEAAQRHGILDFVAADIAGTIDERPFAENVRRLVCGTAVHAERRVHEMADVIALLRDMGSSMRMTRTTRTVLQDVLKMGLRERFGGREPDSIAPVIEAIAAARA
jgi:3-hydroxyisobutyrate dehydrogenase-like beta-hydroxyacid dehydrogenase